MGIPYLSQGCKPIWVLILDLNYPESTRFFTIFPIHSIQPALLKEKISLSILNDFPKVRIISVDLEDNKLILLSGTMSLEPSTEDLLHMIAA